MATTTNYNWATPDDTDLVKDGASAIRTLGSSADTTVKNLNPGTTAGDIDYYTSSTAKARIGIGTAGQVLQVNSGATAPEWATLAGGGGKVLQVVQGTLTSSFTTTSTTYVDSGLSISITPSSASSKVLIYVSGFGQVDRTGAVTAAQGQYNLVRTSTQLQSFQIGYSNFASSTAPEIQGALNASYLDSPATTSATTYKVQCKSDTTSSTTTRIIATATQIASIVAMEIGA